MKKIINQPENVLEEMVSGIIRANEEKLERLEDSYVIKQRNLNDQVSLVSGGGSGHEPSHAGFVGDGMLQAAVCGQVFTSPTTDEVLKAIQAVDTGKGVLLIIKNYSGDVMNFEMAMEMAEMEDIEVRKVIIDDDIALEEDESEQGKRGVAGTVLLHKILGAAARKGYSLDELAELGQAVVDNVNSLGVGLRGATVPEVGKPGFTLEEDEIEFGIGIHGEAGYKREKLQPSKEMASEMLGKLKEAFNWSDGDEFALLVNGMGGTPLMEQYIFFNDTLNHLEADGIQTPFRKVGDYMTSIEMQGVSLTLLKLQDDWLDLLNEDVDTIGW